MDHEMPLESLFSSIKEFPSRQEAFETINSLICENNITDELKTSLISRNALDTFQSHLKTWNPEKPVKPITENLNLILLMSDKLPEISYMTLSLSGYLTEVLNIFFGCLKFLTERKQVEIDENCNLSLVLSCISKYAVKFYLKEKTKSPSCVGLLFFKKALHFLMYKGYEFAKNPNNCAYVLTLTNTLNYLISQDNAYKSIFVEMNGIQYCLGWLSNSYKDRRNFFQIVLYDLRILSILDKFVGDQYFMKHQRAVAARLVKYLRLNGETILSNAFKEECYLVFECACNILIKMAVEVEGSRQHFQKFRLKQLLLSYMSKYEIFAKTIYATILVLEEANETAMTSEIENITDMEKIMRKLESLSYILTLSSKYNISVS